MKDFSSPKNLSHFPVMLEEVLKICNPSKGGNFIDCTFGYGGYTNAILSYPKTKVLAIDRDLNTKKFADITKKNYKNRFTFHNKKFSDLSKVADKKTKFDFIVFDLGISTMQIMDKDRGFSFNSNSSIDMRMGLNSISAQEVVNSFSQSTLNDIFKFFGEEKESKFIARNIVKERLKKKLDTQSLVKIIDNTKRKKNFKVHSATKVFQALRIFVNKEISELIFGLINATKVLKKDGVLAVVTFHSLEDKIVKYFLKSLSEKKSISRYAPITEQPETLLKLNEKKAIVPSDKEISENLPSRSAKLRYAIKKTDFYDFKTDILDQFSNLIEIENFGKKLWKKLH